MKEEQKIILKRYQVAFIKAMHLTFIPTWGIVSDPWTYHSDGVISKMCLLLKFPYKKEARLLNETSGTPMDRFCQILKSEEDIKVNRFISNTRSMSLPKSKKITDNRMILESGEVK